MSYTHEAFQQTEVFVKVERLADAEGSDYTATVGIE